jgi:ATP synthase F1, delta subunit
MTDLAEEYGKGLYDLTEEEHVSEDVLAQLRVLRGLFRDQPDFIRLLCNMSLAKEERTAILDGALRGQVHPYVLNFLKILCERGALHEFEGCVSAFTALYNQAHGIVEASVTTGVPLEEEQRTRLIDKLSAMTGKRIVLSEKVDPGVVGGVLLEMNGKRYDNTLRHRLQAIHAALIAEA